MISLRYPFILLLLLLLPLLWHLRYGRKRQSTVLFSDGSLLQSLPRSWAVSANRLLPYVYITGLALLVVALCRPQRGLEESLVHTEAVDIVLLVDVSTSMRALDFSTLTKQANRLDASKEVIDDFIKNRGRDRIGMVAFAALPYTIAPLTLDHAWLRQQLDRVKTGMLEDGTAIGSALASAINRLRDSEAKSKVVVLLTDGVNTAGSLSPLNAAQAAKALGIKVYTVGAGREGLVPYPVQDPFGGMRTRQMKSEIDEKTLQEIADMTEARFFRAKDAETLAEVYKEIDALEKTEIEVEQYTRFEELFQPFAIIGLLLVLAEKLLGYTRIGRLV